MCVSVAKSCKPVLLLGYLHHSFTIQCVVGLVGAGIWKTQWDVKSRYLSCPTKAGVAA